MLSLWKYEGKNIKLRLTARTQSPESQSEGKLITGWFKDCGLDIVYSVMEDGALSDDLYSYDKSGAYAPDYDMYLWSYAGYADPGDTLASFITDQIEWWNDPCWSNAEYDGSHEKLGQAAIAQGVAIKLANSAQ